MLLHLFAENSMQNSCNYLGKMSNAENSAYLQVLTGLFPFLTRRENRSLYVWKTFENKIEWFGVWREDRSSEEIPINVHIPHQNKELSNLSVVVRGSSGNWGRQDSQISDSAASQTDRFDMEGG